MSSRRLCCLGVLLVVFIVSFDVVAEDQDFNQVPDAPSLRGWSKIDGTVICKSGNWTPGNVRLSILDRGYLYNNYIVENQVLNLPCHKLCSFDLEGTNGVLGIRPQLQITHDCHREKPATVRFDVDKGHMRSYNDIELE